MSNNNNNNNKLLGAFDTGGLWRYNPNLLPGFEGRPNWWHQA